MINDFYAAQAMRAPAPAAAAEPEPAVQRRPGGASGAARAAEAAQRPLKAAAKPGGAEARHRVRQARCAGSATRSSAPSRARARTGRCGRCASRACGCRRRISTTPRTHHALHRLPQGAGLEDQRGRPDAGHRDLPACHQGEQASAAVPSTCTMCHDYHRDELPPILPRPAQASSAAGGLRRRPRGGPVAPGQRAGGRLGVPEPGRRRRARRSSQTPAGGRRGRLSVRRPRMRSSCSRPSWRWARSRLSRWARSWRRLRIGSRSSLVISNTSASPRGTTVALRGSPGQQRELAERRAGAHLVDLALVAVGARPEHAQQALDDHEQRGARLARAHDRHARRTEALARPPGELAQLGLGEVGEQLVAAQDRVQMLAVVECARRHAREEQVALGVGQRDAGVVQLAQHRALHGIAGLGHGAVVADPVARQPADAELGEGLDLDVRAMALGGDLAARRSWPRAGCARCARPAARSRG